ncbi:MAG: hypothetical protein HFI84_09530 [Eubacterium sp.]|nr:hypothetical protein [Eubacterium sp.]
MNRTIRADGGAIITATVCPYLFRRLPGAAQGNKSIGLLHTAALSA